MKIEVGEHGALELRDVFNLLTLRIDDETLSIVMRDGGFEFRYGRKVYFARGSVIHEAYPGGRKLAADSSAVLLSISEDLAVMKRNTEIAANISLEDLEIRGRTLYPWLQHRKLYPWLQHRKDIAQRLLASAGEPQDDGVINALHELFDYDQAQLRELLGLMEIGDTI